MAFSAGAHLYLAKFTVSVISHEEPSCIAGLGVLRVWTCQPTQMVGTQDDRIIVQIIAHNLHGNSEDILQIAKKA